jgi:hypothetical protein
VDAYEKHEQDIEITAITFIRKIPAAIKKRGT